MRKFLLIGLGLCLLGSLWKAEEEEDDDRTRVDDELNRGEELGVGALLQRIDELTPALSGVFRHANGEQLPW